MLLSDWSQIIKETSSPHCVDQHDSTLGCWLLCFLNLYHWICELQRTAFLLRLQFFSWSSFMHFTLFYNSEALWEKEKTNTNYIINEKVHPSRHTCIIAFSFDQLLQQHNGINLQLANNSFNWTQGRFYDVITCLFIGSLFSVNACRIFWVRGSILCVT